MNNRRCILEFRLVGMDEELSWSLQLKRRIAWQQGGHASDIQKQVRHRLTTTKRDATETEVKLVLMIWRHTSEWSWCQWFVKCTSRRRATAFDFFFITNNSWWNVVSYVFLTQFTIELLETNRERLLPNKLFLSSMKLFSDVINLTIELTSSWKTMSCVVFVFALMIIVSRNARLSHEITVKKYLRKDLRFERLRP